MIRTGIGYDAHKLRKGGKLIIGGVEIESTHGSVGHSDGDALIHAIVDALLGAAALGDIGMYFPSNSDEWKNASSRIFLEKAVHEINHKGYEISHVDSVVILQEPKLRSHIEIIRENLAHIMGVEKDSISVKATTTDHLGFEGNKIGWSVQALATLRVS